MMQKIRFFMGLALCLLTTIGSSQDNAKMLPELSYKDALRLENKEISWPDLIKELQQNAVENSENNNASMAGGRSIPANDDCLGATTLSLNDADFTFTTAGATVNSTDPVPASWGMCTSAGKYLTVWFKFTITTTKNIAVSTLGSLSNSSVYKAKYAVFSGTCGNLTQIGRTLTGSYGNIDSKRIELLNLPAGTYYIMASGPCNEIGTYKLRLDEAPSTLTSLWYPAITLPEIKAGMPVVSAGQWGSYAADGPEKATSNETSMQYSDYYKFVYNSEAMKGIHIIDQTSQAAFMIVLYDDAGAEIVSNKFSTTDAYASFTWDRSVQSGIAMHMPNISLAELGLIEGKTYYIRISHNLPTRYNTNNKGKTYTLQVGNYAPSADTYKNDVTLTLTKQPVFSWLNGQKNLRAGHALETEPEGKASSKRMENSLIYKFNSNKATAIDVNLRNITYYSYSGLSGTVSVQTSPTGGVALKSGAFSTSSYNMSVTGLTPYTDYWIVIDGAGTYAGTQLSFDIAVTTFAPLPIELKIFNAAYTGEKVDINWTTSAEINNDYFTVEKTIDGKRFETVGIIDGAGNSNKDLDYFLADKKPFPGVSYYRLKQTDFDGKFEYSELIKVIAPETGKFKLFPNPATTDITIEYEGSEPGELFIYDITGRIVKKELLSNNEGINTLKMDVNSLSPGNYFLELRNGAVTVREKLVKIK